MTDITVVALIAKIKEQTESFDTVVLKEVEAKALVEALEKAQSKATQQGNIACELFDEVNQLRRTADDKAPELRAQLIEADSELETLRQRIAELESRTVTVKLTDYRATYKEPFALEIEHHVRKALKDVADAAGIQVIEGEG